MTNATNAVPEAQIPDHIQKAALQLRWAGRIGFWSQLATTIGAGSLLFLAILGRNIGEGGDNNVATGFAIFLAVAGIALMGFSIWISFRYTRFARQLLYPVSADAVPSKEETLSVGEFGLWVALAGALVCLLGAEISAIALLAKAMSQPQGAAIYTPDKVIRVLDIVVIVVNTGVGFIHFVATAGTIWLLKQVS